MELKIRNAQSGQWSVVADMALCNLWLIEKTGVRNGVHLMRGQLGIYLYLAKSGKLLVAHVK